MHDNGACSEHLSGNGWGTADNVLAWAKENGKTIAVGDQYDVPMGGPLTYGSVGHNWANAQNTPLRRYKANVHEGGACTPCIMHWPAGMKYRGEITRQRGHVVDLMATCIELAGAKYPEEFNGKPIIPHESLSLVPVITGGAAAARPRLLLQPQPDASRDPRRLEDGPRARRSLATVQLAENRTETKDLARLHPEIVANLIALYETWSQRNGRIPRPMQ